MNTRTDSRDDRWREYISLRRWYYLSFAAFLLVGLLTLVLAGPELWSLAPVAAVALWHTWLWLRVRVWPCPCCGRWFNSFRRSLPGSRCVHCRTSVTI